MKNKWKNRKKLICKSDVKEKRNVKLKNIYLNILFM